MWIVILLKWVTISALGLFGSVVLLAGLGARIPYASLLGLEAYQLPVGALILFCAVLLARSWRIASEREVTTSTKVSNLTFEQNQPIIIERTTTEKTRLTAKDFDDPCC